MISDRIRSMQIGVDVVCELEAKLRACKRENREMWEKMRRNCKNFRTGCGEYCAVDRENCNRRNCPLLKGVKK